MKIRQQADGGVGHRLTAAGGYARADDLAGCPH
jgi:hypothetical protein